MIRATLSDMLRFYKGENSIPKILSVQNSLESNINLMLDRIVVQNLIKSRLCIIIEYWRSEKHRDFLKKELHFQVRFKFFREKDV